MRSIRVSACKGGCHELGSLLGPWDRPVCACMHASVHVFMLQAGPQARRASVSGRNYG